MVALAYGNGVFTALGQSGIYTSTDGAAWIMQAQLFYSPNRVAYGNGLFVATGPAGAMFLSVGGTNVWTTIESDASGSDLNGILFNSGLFVAVGASGTILTSTLPDAGSLPPKMNWNWGRFAPGVTDTSDDLSSVAYGSSMGFVAVGRGPSTSFASANGIQWTESSAGLDNAGPLYGVSYYNGDYVAVDSNGGIFSSPFGTTWTPRAATGASLAGIAAFGGEFVAVGDNGAIYTGPSTAPPTQWTVVNSGTKENLRAVAGGNTLWEFVAVGDTGTILASKDLGTSWSPQTSGTVNHLDGVVYGNGRYVAVGEGGVIVVSTNGTAWTPAATNYNYTGTDLYTVTYGNGLFVAAGEDGWTAVSRDGSTWAWSSSATINSLRGIAYNNGAFVAVGDSGTVMLSVAPRLGPVTVLASGSVQVSVTGGPSQKIQIQVSTDLLHWSVLTTVTLDLNGTGQFTDPAATTTPDAFYRAIAL